MTLSLITVDYFSVRNHVPSMSHQISNNPIKKQPLFTITSAKYKDSDKMGPIFSLKIGMKIEALCAKTINKNLRDYYYLAI